MAFSFESLIKIQGVGTILNNIDMPVYRCNLFSHFDNLVSIIFIVFLTQDVTSVQSF
jgi:hypothetical protein